MPNALITLIACSVALAMAALACQDRTPAAPAPTSAAPESSCPPSCPASVTGTLAYSENVALPPDAVVRVRLEDVSIADAPSVIIAERTIANPGQFPIQFEIGYDPSRIDGRFDYAVQATISRGDTLLFINDTVYSVLTRGNPSSVDMVLIKVAP